MQIEDGYEISGQISVVGIVTGLWTGYPRTPSIPSRVRGFSSPQHRGWLLAPSSLVFSEQQGSLPLGVERDHSSKCSAKIKNEWGCTCPPICGD